MAVPPSRVAGWYPDPHAQNVQRYWNGRVWTAKTMPLPAAPAPGADAAPGGAPLSPVAPQAPGLPTGVIVAGTVIADLGGL